MNQNLTKKSYKNTGIYNTGCITIKEIDVYESINSVNPLYVIIDKADEYIEENNGNKYLVITSTDGCKKSISKIYKTLG